MLVRAHFAGPEGRPERHRLHRRAATSASRRSSTCSQLARAGQGVGDAREDAAYQPLPHQRQPGIWSICPVTATPAHRKPSASEFAETHHRLRTPSARRMHFLFVLVGHPASSPRRSTCGSSRCSAESGIPFGIVFTKADKLSTTQRDTSVERFRTALAQQWEELPPMFVSSSENGRGPRRDPRLHRRMSATELTPAVTQREETSRGYGMKTGPQRKSLTEC